MENIRKVSNFIKNVIDIEKISDNLNTNYYTSVETEEKIVSAITDLSLIYEPIGARSDLINSINDLSGVYTPLSSFNNLENDLLTGYLTEAEISSNYYNKDEIITNVLSSYMTDVEVSQAIQNSQHIKKEIVNTLPEIQNALQNTIYMVSNSTSLSSNIYDEYMVINNNWERLGNTAIDITNYANLNNENTFLNDQTISGDLTVNDTITAQSGYFSGNVNVGARSLNGYLTYVDTLYRMHIVGYDIVTLQSTSFQPTSEGIYKHTLSNNDVITFITTQLSNTKITTFELHLIQPATPVSFTFTNSIKWIHDLNFNSSNSVPDFSEGNKEYAIVIRWDGTEFLGNLIYTKDIETE